MQKGDLLGPGGQAGLARFDGLAVPVDADETPALGQALHDLLGVAPPAQGAVYIQPVGPDRQALDAFLQQHRAVGIGSAHWCPLLCWFVVYHKIGKETLRSSLFFPAFATPMDAIGFFIIVTFPVKSNSFLAEDGFSFPFGFIFRWDLHPPPFSGIFNTNSITVHFV